MVAPAAIWANGFSYIYIQGDKATPFYVKFEDQMLPRYGKNYSVIPQLVPGPVNIQILFQQNTYPAQRFTVVVPENGFRGFLLLQKNGVFSLYDIQQQFYLYPGNKAEDDRVSPFSGADAYVNTNIQPSQPEKLIEPIPSNSTNTVNTVKKPKSTAPKFLPNVELSNEHTPQYYTPPPAATIAEEPAVEETYIAPTQDVAIDKKGNVVTRNPIIVNSDCPNAISEKEFEDLYNKVHDKIEKVRLKFLLTKVTGCYNTQQSRLLAETLNNDPERYTFLKKVYPRVTDQHNFAALENLLSTQEWKSYFKLILPK